MKIADDLKEEYKDLKRVKCEYIQPEAMLQQDRALKAEAECDTLRPCIERLTNVIDGLTQQLAEQRETISDLRSDNEYKTEQVRVLQEHLKEEDKPVRIHIRGEKEGA